MYTNYAKVLLQTNSKSKLGFEWNGLSTTVPANAESETCKGDFKKLTYTLLHERTSCLLHLDPDKLTSKHLLADACSISF